MTYIGDLALETDGLTNEQSIMHRTLPLGGVQRNSKEVFLERVKIREATLYFVLYGKNFKIFYFSYFKKNYIYFEKSKSLPAR